MLKLNKKGFTIVELVIVIAVVAILAAVLIPTFINLMQTANESADIQLVTNLNKLMAMQEALDGKNATMQDALDDAFANGYDISKISPTSKGNDIVWDQTADRFALVNPTEGKLIFRDEATPIKNLDGGEIYTLWKIYDEKTGFPTKQTYSIYWIGAATNVPETVSVGFDAGNCTEALTINYTNTTAEQNVIFNLNGGKLTVNDTTKSTQSLYGFVEEADITTGNECFYVYGTVAKATVNEGTVIAKKNSILVVDFAKSGSTVNKEGGIVMAAAGKSLGDNVAVSDETEVKNFALEISDAAGLAAFRDSVNGGMTYAGLTVKLTADIDLSTQGNWNPIGNRYALNDSGTPVDTTKNDKNKAFRKAFMGTFDGQGHTISGLFIDTSDVTNYKGVKMTGSDSTYAALFGYVDQATVKNFTVNGRVFGCDVAGVIGILGEGCTVDGIVSNVTVGGTAGENEEKLLRGKAGGIINMTKGDNSTIKNCINNGNVRSDESNVENRGDYAGGIIALIQHATTIENCKNTGAVTTNNYYVGGIVGAASDNATGKSQFIVEIKKCENTGKITLTGSADPKDKGVGAIIGLCGAASAVRIDSCTNAKTAEISGKETYDKESLVGVNAPSGKGTNVTGVEPRKSN